jgi:hypothetical protein
MKNDYCELTYEQIAALPERFKGFLFSPFQFNLSNGYVGVPEDTFKEMIDIITEYATREASAPTACAADDQPADKDADTKRLDFMIEKEAWIAWGRDSEKCRLFHYDEDTGTNLPVMGWTPDAWASTPRQAIDAAAIAVKQQGDTP